MKKLLSIFFFILLAGLITAQVSKTVNVSTAGTLYSFVTENEKTTITNLTVSGNINFSDFYTMTSMPFLNVLDLSGATINAYTEQGGYYRSFAANALPNNSFDNTIAKPSQIKLPNNLISIGGGSFNLNTNLESITIPASVTDIGPFAFNYCSKLKKVIFLSTTPPTLGTSVSRIVFAPVGDMSNLPSIYVPIGCVNTFKSTTDKDMWRQFDIYESILTTRTQNTTNITLSSATLNGSIEFIYNTVNAYGFCWNTTGSPTISDSKIDKGATTMLGAYDYTVTNLQPSTTYYVRAYAADGTGTVYGNEVSFKTAKIPDPADNISGNQIVCQGQNGVTYTVPVIPSATSYIWSLPTGVTGTSTTNSITVNFAKTFTSGSIMVGGHNQWGDGASSTISITANFLPGNAEVISGRTSVCQGESSVTYTVPAIANATSYTWTLPMGGTLNIPTNYITINYPTTTSSGILSVKGHNDCGDGVQSTLPITVNQLPVISVSDTALICGGSAPLWANTNYIGSGTLKYKWTPSTGLDNDTIANPLSTITSDITYTITVTTPSGCSTSKNATVKVNPLTVNAGTDKIVNSGSAILLHVNTNYTGARALKYKWSPSTGLNNDSIASPTATVITNTNYTVTITTPNGCTGSDNIFVGITPMAKPEIGIVGIINNKNRIVWNKPVSTGISSYNIYKETTVSDVYEKVGNVSYDSLSVFVDNQSAPDVKSNKYKISVIDKSGLESPQSNAHKTMHLSINKGQNNAWNLIWEPYEGFAVSTYNIYRGTSPNSLNFLDATSGSSTQYSDITASAGDVYYQLEVISPSLVSPTKVPGDNQKVKEEESTITTALVSYSSSRSNVATNVLSGTTKISDEKNICIYPNPVKDELWISFEGGSKFDIVDLMGVVVFSGNLNESNIVRTSGLSQGVYLMRFKQKNSILTKKFIKM
ncbi:MAG: T9SS type A sorting domain-containing protein [Paludibacter sp.]|nr:T9SS type A sorting domain-containing protein [Paludibacter sp.]